MATIQAMMLQQFCGQQNFGGSRPIATPSLGLRFFGKLAGKPTKQWEASAPGASSTVAVEDMDEGKGAPAIKDKDETGEEGEDDTGKDENGEDENVVDIATPTSSIAKRMSDAILKEHVKVLNERKEASVNI
jgi:hypothetical protein